MSYSSIPASKAQALFAQMTPNAICQNKGKMEHLSVQCGFQCKCRDPRCSLACYVNYRQKEAKILSHFLSHYLPDHFHPYRGNLMMPEGATVEAHRKTLERFNRLLQDWCKANGVTVRFYAYTDITAPDAQHYDIIAYADRPAKPDRVREMIVHLWKRAGGNRASCLPIGTKQERVARAIYAAKGRKADRRPKWLPIREGLDLCRGSRGFWCGWTKAGLWDD
jgi:hypothetical protein